MEDDLTVQELCDELKKLIEIGCGDYEVIVSYDTGYVGTSIRNKSPKINKQPMKKYCSVIFEGY